MIVEEIDIGELVEECFEARIGVARAHGVALEADLDDPRATLRGDRHLLKAAVTNLVETAIKGNRPGGRVIISHRSDAGRDSIVVTDNGRGLRYEELRGINDLFCRPGAPGIYDVEELDAEILGFSIVKDIADLHGGRIGVRSMEGEGSTFTLYLPRLRRGVA